MKVSYLHGLESPNHGPKVDWLNEKFNTYVPSIDYKNENAFEEVLDGCRGSDLIVGSSMGGYFAYLIGQHLRVPTILFNPAVVSRKFDPNVELPNRNGTKNTVYLGKNDNVVKGSKIKKYFSNEGVGSFKYTVYDGGHRVPEDVFIRAISETLKIKESRVHSFESFHITKLLEADTYSDYPKAATNNAQQAIDWKEKYGRDEVTAATRVGWARAHQLAKGENLSADTVKRMSAFNRHRKNSKIDTKYKDTPWKDNGYVAWLTWGGDEGVDWAIKTSKEILNEGMKTKGWGNDPEKPKAIDKVEIRVHKWISGLKRGWTENTQYSPKLDRLRREWEAVIDEHKDEWEPKYNFGDLLA